MRYITAKIQLPVELSDYTNIFNKESAGELPPNHPGDHAIETDGKDPPYGPLFGKRVDQTLYQPSRGTHLIRAEEGWKPAIIHRLPRLK